MSDVVGLQNGKAAGKIRRSDTPAQIHRLTTKSVAMKITVISHNLSSNAVMRAHRLAEAARTFAEVRLIGPVELNRGLWPALPAEPWIETVRERRIPHFCKPFIKLTEIADGDVLIAVKPHLGSFGVALVAAERREVPVILDLEEFDAAHAPRLDW